MREHLLLSAHHLYLCVRRLHVEHRRQVAAAEQCVADEPLCLLCPAAAYRPEMVGTCTDAVLAGLGIVFQIETVADGRALRRLDIDERHGIVCRAADVLAAPLAHAGDAQLVPMDGNRPPSLTVLVLRYINAVDAFCGVAHPFAHKPVILPDAHPQARLILGIGLCRQSEAVATTVSPMTFVIASFVGTRIGPVPFRFLLAEVTCIVA